VAELHDIELFKQPPPDDDCPICFLLLPCFDDGRRYQSCCGKVICTGCIHAMGKICPFCRATTPNTDKDIIKRTQKRVDVDDAKAIFCLGCDYSDGTFGVPQDRTKALELWHRAAELGYTTAYFNIGNEYYNGIGAASDIEKANHYYELAAMGGDVDARYNLGIFEEGKGNTERALKHYMIAVMGGYSDSLKQILDFYSRGLATKDDYTKALLSYQEYLNEVKSSQRDEAAAAREDYKYMGRRS